MLITQHPHEKLREVKGKESPQEERRSYEVDRDGEGDMRESDGERMTSQEVGTSNQRFYCFWY